MQPSQPLNDQVPQQSVQPQTPPSVAPTPLTGPAASDQRILEIALPVNRNGFAIAAGYVALFSIPIVPAAPIAVILGIVALVQLKSAPQKRGRGRAWFAIAYGGIVTIVFAALLLSQLF